VQVSTAIAIYFLVWWLTLFVVLPFGVRSQHEGEDYAQGTDPGAPILAGIGRKLIWTTVVASLIFAALALVYTSGWFNFAALTDWMRPRRY
jgi:predicted secreted protein